MKFIPSQLPPEAFSYTDWMRKLGCTKAEAKRHVASVKAERVYVSEDGLYQAHVSPWDDRGMLHISVKRTDKAAWHDWRVMQEIKNALVGPEREACELYPAESRLIDTANQYHLWVLPEGMCFGFGWNARLVHGPGEGPQLGERQRAFGAPIDAQ